MKRTRLAMTLCIPLLANLAPAGIIYVDDDAPPGGDGQSWTTAFMFLQDALAAAQPGDEIRAAHGTYEPDRSTTNPSGSADRAATFQLISSVGLYGGYAGYGAPDPDARDTNLFATMLSGDLAGNDQPNWGNYAENSYHVVTGSNVNATAVLDGFTVTAGNADGNGLFRVGAGMYVSAGSPTLTGCKLVSNLVEWNGAGLAVENGGPLITGCDFSDNQTPCSGGGMYVVGGSAVLEGCTFSGNTAALSETGGTGGGLANQGGNLSLVRCNFIGNWSNGSLSYGHGGGLFSSGGTVSLSECIFTANAAAHGGGVGVSGGVATLDGCSFTSNSANMGGGGLWLSAPARVARCLFVANTSGVHWSYHYVGGGGVLIVDQTVGLIGCQFIRNFVTADQGLGGGGAVANIGAALFFGCSFLGNHVANGNGGAVFALGSTALNCCAFVGNRADSEGGAIYDFAFLNLWNCTATANSAENGNAIAKVEDPQHQFSGPMHGANCVLRNGGNEIWITDTCTHTLVYSNVEGGWNGSGNIDADPRFARTPSPGPDDTWGTADDDYGDLRVLTGSQCIDAGANTNPARDSFDLDGDGCITDPTPIDLDGYARFADDLATPDTGNGIAPIVDMGAYEFYSTPVVPPGPCPGDLDCNGLINFDDVNPFVLALSDPAAYVTTYPDCDVMNADANNDGVVNFDDINSFVALLSQ